MNLVFNKYSIELSNDDEFRIGPAENNFEYDFVYHDKEAINYKSSQHAIKIFVEGQLYKSAILCAVAGATTIHSHSAIIDNNDIFMCCANKVFSLALPNLTLNWLTEVDMATCFGIYKADNGLFTHGELSVTRLNKSGEKIWETGFKDIIVNIEENKSQDKFVMTETYISLLDFNNNKYQLGFDGKFLKVEKSEKQKNLDLLDEKRIERKHKKNWWKFW